jgi:hypothetical protein
MRATQLLAELAAAGIDVSRAGDNLRVRAHPGVRLTPHVACLRQHKSALLAELLKREIVAAVTVDAAEFDRPGYERLLTLWARFDDGSASA